MPLGHANSLRCAHGCAAAALLAAVSVRTAADVEVSGVEGELLDNVRTYLPDAPPCDADGETVARYAEALPERLRAALDAFGHYEAAVAATLEGRSENCWRVRVAIDPGPQVAVRETSVRLAGAAEHDADMRALFSAFPLEPGDPLLHARYREFKDGVDVLARQRGYLEGEFTAERIDVYVDARAADITLVYDSGPRYRFGDIVFDTDGALADDVLENFLGFAEGDPYDASLVGRLQQELVASRYFARALVTADVRSAANERIPIRVSAVPSEPRSYTIGGGYSTDDGPRIRFTYDNDRRNRAGHQLHAQATLAQVTQTAVLEYRVPISNPQRDWRSFGLGLERDDFIAGVSSAARFSVQRTQAGEHLTATRFIDALFEQDEIADFSFSSSMLIPGISWLRSYRDDLVRPREGHRLALVLAGGVGSEVSLLRADFRGKWITAMPWDARVIVRGRLGALIEDGPFGFVPLSMRFFAGGDNSVRGYDYQSLGPRDQFGDLIGGNRLIEASVEYEHPLRENWSAAVFVDSGNAFLDAGFEPQTGAGIGARWFSPLGPIRFDIAWPLDGSGRSPELHLSLGPDL